MRDIKVQNLERFPQGLGYFSLGSVGVPIERARNQPFCLRTTVISCIPTICQALCYLLCLKGSQSPRKVFVDPILQMRKLETKRSYATCPRSQDHGDMESAF